jgi:hypothetical protein
VEIRGTVKIAGLESGNGFVVAISPEPGLTGESEGAASRTDLMKVPQVIEAAGTGTSIPEREPGDGQSFRGSERPLRDAGSGRNERQATFEAVIRRSQKGVAGSRGAIAGHSGCKAPGRACRRRTWLSFGSLGTISFLGVRPLPVTSGAGLSSPRLPFSFSPRLTVAASRCQRVNVAYLPRVAVSPRLPVAASDYLWRLTYSSR